MFRAVLCFVLGVLIGGCSTPANVTPQAPTKSEQAADLTAKTVALIERDDDDAPGAATPRCSGVWVSLTSILTAFHCVRRNHGEPVEYAVRSDVYDGGGTHTRQPIGGHVSGVYALDPGHDLALLRAVNAPPHGIAHVSPTPGIAPGAPVQTMGHPMGLWFSFSSGDVAAVRQAEINDRDLVWIQTTAPISPGNSGGGLFDANGHLVGLAHAQARGQNLNLYVHAQYLDAFVRAQGAAL